MNAVNELFTGVAMLHYIIMKYTINVCKYRTSILNTVYKIKKHHNFKYNVNKNTIVLTNAHLIMG